MECLLAEGTGGEPAARDFPSNEFFVFEFDLGLVVSMVGITCTFFFYLVISMSYKLSSVVLQYAEP
jgi:hypothetical protein